MQRQAIQIQHPQRETCRTPRILTIAHLPSLLFRNRPQYLRTLHRAKHYRSMSTTSETTPLLRLNNNNSCTMILSIMLVSRWFPLHNKPQLPVHPDQTRPLHLKNQSLVATRPAHIHILPFLSRRCVSTFAVHAEDETPTAYHAATDAPATGGNRQERYPWRQGAERRGCRTLVV